MVTCPIDYAILTALPVLMSCIRMPRHVLICAYNWESLPPCTTFGEDDVCYILSRRGRSRSIPKCSNVVIPFKGRRVTSNGTRCPSSNKIVPIRMFNIARLVWRTLFESSPLLIGRAWPQSQQRDLWAYFRKSTTNISMLIVVLRGIVWFTNPCSLPLRDPTPT